MEQSVILKPEHIKCHMRMLLEGLGYLHDNFVLHRVSCLPHSGRPVRGQAAMSLRGDPEYLPARVVTPRFALVPFCTKSVTVRRTRVHHGQRGKTTINEGSRCRGSKLECALRARKYSSSLHTHNKYAASTKLFVLRADQRNSKVQIMTLRGKKFVAPSSACMHVFIPGRPPRGLPLIPHPPKPWTANHKNKKINRISSPTTCCTRATGR